MQTQLNFEVHQRENTPENEARLNDNKERWGEQTKKLFNYLMTGKRLNADSAMSVLGIRHLPRRKKDLTEFNGVKISGGVWENKLLTVFMTHEDIEFNKRIKA